MENERKTQTNWNLKVEEAAFDNIPDGVYKAQLVSLDRKTVKSEYGDGRENEIVLLNFAIKSGGPECEGKTINGIASYKLSPKSKLYKWLEALGLKMEVGKTIDLTDAVTKTASIVVKNKTKTYNNEQVEMSNVSDVLPLQK